MGFAQVLVCDGGCGARDDALASWSSTGGSAVTIPQGWHVRNIGSEATFEPRGLRVITVCPECWGTKTLAEVLGS